MVQINNMTKLPISVHTKQQTERHLENSI
uniref:Uncharacterized protein n=1 Tax=Arundo donax TaxID=35708 RepID=A0A0A8ZWT6_ARUDO